MRFKTYVALLLVALVLIFVFQNTQTVEVRFLVWTIETSRALILFITLLIGLVAGSVLGRSGKRK